MAVEEETSWSGQPRLAGPRNRAEKVQHVLSAIRLLSAALEMNREHPQGSIRAAVSMSSAITLADDAIKSLARSASSGNLRVSSD